MSASSSQLSPGGRGDTSLQDKVVLVTGAAGGIGSAVVDVFVDGGAVTCGADLRRSETWRGATFVQADFADSAAVANVVAQVVDAHGRLDALVHTVGITDDAVLWKLGDEQWSRVLSANLDSAFYLLRAATPHLRERGGSVVLVSSINGERGKFGQANYAASKAGLIGLGKTAARELGRFGVRVNCVLPGLVRTTMTATLPAEVVERAREEAVLARVAEPEDVADVVWFLCSDLGRHVTGQSLRVDGGQLIA